MATDLMEWWRLYLPAHLRAVEPDRPEGTDLAIWRDDSIAGAPYAYGFQGNARKPVWAYRFGSVAYRERFIAEKIEARKAHFARKAERSVARKTATHSLAVGDILSSSWGYDQTNVDFYQVVDVPGPKSVVIRQISAALDSGAGCSGDKVTPCPGAFIGEPMLKRVNERGNVKIESFAWASKWSGRPMHQTSPFAGH